MRIRLRYVVPVILLTILGAFFVRGLDLNPTYIESPLIGQQAPAFTLPVLGDPDAVVSSDDMAGDYALLNVWATWCMQCRHEHPFLLELARSGMPIYGIDWKDSPEDALLWLDTLGNPYVATAEDQIGRVAIDYGVYAAPESILLAPDLTILQKFFGPLNEEIWEQEFVPAINLHRAEN